MEFQFCNMVGVTVTVSIDLTQVRDFDKLDEWLATLDAAVNMHIQDALRQQLPQLKAARFLAGLTDDQKRMLAGML